LHLRFFYHLYYATANHCLRTFWFYSCLRTGLPALHLRVRYVTRYTAGLHWRDGPPHLPFAFGPHTTFCPYATAHVYAHSVYAVYFAPHHHLRLRPTPPRCRGTLRLLTFTITHYAFLYIAHVALLQFPDCRTFPLVRLFYPTGCWFYTDVAPTHLLRLRLLRVRTLPRHDRTTNPRTRFTHAPHGYAFTLHLHLRLGPRLDPFGYLHTGLRTLPHADCPTPFGLLHTHVRLPVFTFATHRTHVTTVAARFPVRFTTFGSAALRATFWRPTRSPDPATTRVAFLPVGDVTGLVATPTPHLPTLRYS